MILQAGQKQTIQVQTPDNLELAIEISNGPAGLAVTVRKTNPWGPDISYSLIDRGDNGADGQLAGDAYLEVELVQYRQDAYNQAFKAWYQKQGPHPGPRPELVKA